MNQYTHGPSDEGLTAQSVCRLLSEGMTPVSEPVRSMLDWLTRRGDDALVDAMNRVGVDAEAVRAMLGGSGGEKQCHAIKRASKEHHRRAEDQDDRDSALAVYFLAVALGLVCGGTNISSRPFGELSDAFSEIAGAAPPPWQELFNTAAMRVSGVKS